MSFCFKTRTCIYTDNMANFREINSGMLKTNILAKIYHCQIFVKTILSYLVEKNGKKSSTARWNTIFIELGNYTMPTLKKL